MPAAFAKGETKAETPNNKSTILPRYATPSPTMTTPTL